MASHGVRARDGRPNDVALVQRVASGDVVALGALYDLFAPAILRYALRVADAHDAEDILQTVFVRVFQAARSFDPRALSARPWLFGIATRVVLERRRAAKRFAAALFTLATHSTFVVQNRGEASSDLEWALERLSPVKRTVLVLIEAEGFRCEEVAEMLDIPIGTVWTRLHHARRELQRLRQKGGL